MNELRKLLLEAKSVTQVIGILELACGGNDGVVWDHLMMLLNEREDACIREGREQEHAFGRK